MVISELREKEEDDKEEEENGRNIQIMMKSSIFACCLALLRGKMLVTFS
jgi:hypothetical protein